MLDLNPVVQAVTVDPPLTKERQGTGRPQLGRSGPAIYSRRDRLRSIRRNILPERRRIAFSSPTFPQRTRKDGAPFFFCGLDF